MYKFLFALCLLFVTCFLFTTVAHAETTPALVNKCGNRAITCADQSVFLPIDVTNPPQKQSAGDKLTDFAIEKLNKVFDATAKAMPKVTEISINVAWVDALSTVLTGLFCLVISFLAAFGAYFFRNCDGPCVVFSIATIFTFVASMANLLDIWAWVGLFHPDLYLIHQLLAKVT